MTNPPEDALTEPVSTFSLDGDPMTREYEYIYASGKLLRQNLTVSIDNGVANYTLDFFYDASGIPFALKYNGDMCYYITNLQGDVMYIVDGVGHELASYQYDPYGNVISATGPLAEINPLRYRGYYFDSETKLYYLQSRYYDPELGRFINADVQFDGNAGFAGYNLFAYCANNPLIYRDDSGRGLILTFTLIGAGLGLLVGGLFGNEVAQAKGYTPDDGWDYFRELLFWGTVGAAAGSVVGYGGAKVATSTWAYYKATHTIGTSAYAIGRAFEEWYYKTHNIVSRQISVLSSRFDAISHGQIIELKNYNWSKYEYLGGLITKFTAQAQKYLSFVGSVIEGQKIVGVTFYFSSKPPQEIIDALYAIGVAVKWAR